MGTSKEIEVSCEVKDDNFMENKKLGFDLNEKKMKRKKRNYVPRFACFRTEKDEKGNFDMEVVDVDEQRCPSHLVVMVNGLIGSAQDWRFAAKHFLKMYPEDVIVHCSERNCSTLTFDGIDVMGERLAEEVKVVIKRHPSATKISFIGHSLGGLIARYAIARLYDENTRGETSHDCENDESKDRFLWERSKGIIAGLEPMNFITSATPHLGSRGHKQVPVFCGSYVLEKVAARTSWWLGRTGKHLFLTDGRNGKPPLLLQMVNDSEDLKFISALRSFRHRVLYSNIRFDSLVGWATSSLRRRNELPKRHLLARNDKYPHIVNIEAATKTSAQVEVSLDAKVGQCNADDMQEQMIRKLTSMSWERVDVSFSGSRQRFLAHSTIQVNRYLLNSDGADVIQHMVDNFII